MEAMTVFSVLMVSSPAESFSSSDTKTTAPLLTVRPAYLQRNINNWVSFAVAESNWWQLLCNKRWISADCLCPWFHLATWPSVSGDDNDNEDVTIPVCDHPTLDTDMQLKGTAAEINITKRNLPRLWSTSSFLILTSHFFPKAINRHIRRSHIL